MLIPALTPRGLVRNLAVFASIALLAPQATFAQDDTPIPPIARTINHFDTIHDTILSDPYHWMRKKDVPDFINYLYAENGYADAVMKSSSLQQKKLLEEMRGRRRETATSLPTKRDNYYYYSRTEKDKDYSIFCRKKDSLTAPEEIYLDQNELAREYMYFSLGLLSISPNQQYLAYGIDNNGDRLLKVYFKDLNTGEVLLDELPNCASLTWANDNKTIFYLVPDVKSKRNYRLYRHRLGDPVSKDQLLYEEADPLYNMGIQRSTSGKYVFLVSGKTNSTEIWQLSTEDPTGKFKMVVSRDTKMEVDANHFEGDNFHFSTNWDALNFRLMSGPIDKPGRENWTEIIPHRDSVILESYALYPDYLVLQEACNTTSRIRIIGRKDNSDYYLPTPEGGSAYVSSFFRTKEPKLRYGFQSMVIPSQTSEYDLSSRKDTLLRTDTVKGYNPNLYETRQVFAIAPDSTRIPISLVHKKGIPMDGTNPTLLTSYGSYGASQFAGFSSSRLSYLDRGFVVAIAHIRGGSDLGRQWYEDGKMLHKKNTFTDFIACAEHLIEAGYTSSEKMAINGGSAGGLLMGAVLNERPDLFQCVVAEVPFVDVINTMLDSTLPLTTFEYEEWGNPHLKKYFDYMLSYSPYENTKAGKYPHMLVTAGYNDSQVGVWEPAKWVAKIRKLKSDTNLLLFQTSMEGGHMGVSGRFNALKEEAFKMAFILRSLGIREEYIQVKGKVVDANENPLPFINVYIEGTTHGTSTNFEGEFVLELKADELSSLVAQGIGFRKHREEIDFKTRTNELYIQMETENIQLKQVVVSAKAKDPAFGIIKNAIAKRKFHLNRVRSYSGDIYIKGLARLNEIPDPEKIPKFLREGMPDSNDLGLVYLSESVARFHFQRPFKFKEEMLASKYAGYSQGISWNRTSDVLFNFYENNLKLDVSERQFVSPISSTAMLFYKYKLLGTFTENGKMINKIEVIPRRKTDPIFHGIIYIVEDQWNIYGLDLFLTKDAQIEFADTIRLSQSFVELRDSTWMPLSLKISYDYKVFGFGVNYNAVGLFSNYILDRRFPDRFFNNEVFRIEEGANKKDSVFWEGTRPVVLTAEEEENYRESDSMEVVQQSKPYLDSIDSKSNEFTIGKMLIGGYSYYKRYDSLRMEINPLISMFQYNTVEGGVIELRPGIYSWKGRKYSGLSGNLRYSTARENLRGRIAAYKWLNWKKFINVRAEGGFYISQFNQDEPISPIVNTGYSLLTGDNFMKIYEKKYGKVSYFQELINGLFIRGGAEYAIRDPLVNQEDFTIFNGEERNITPNNPIPETPSSTALITEVSIAYRYKQQYENHPDRKIILQPKFPTIYATYRKGIDVLGADAKFDFLQVGIGDQVNLGLFGSLRYEVSAGQFLNRDSVTFYDYAHFSGNQTLFLQERSSWSRLGMGGQLRKFHTLDYYSHSTNRGFIEAHAEHHFNGFIFNKFPLIRKLRWQALAGANVLVTEDDNDITELFIGIENIFQVFRIDVAAAYESGEQLRPRVLIGLEF